MVGPYPHATTTKPRESANRRVPAAKYGVVPSSDAELIEASWNDAEAFTQVFERHYQAVYAFSARRVGQSPGRDLAGETFLRAFAGRRLYDLHQQSARPWLIGIARNVVREHLRRAQREAAANRRYLSADRPGSFDVAVLAAATADAREDIAAVARALPTLPDAEVETLLLHVWDRLSYAECARVLGVPVGTVQSRLNRARKRLRDMLGELSIVDGDESPHVEPPAPSRPLRFLGGPGERPL